MTSKQEDTVGSELLKTQIETFTNFDRELVAGASAKSMMAELTAKSRDLWQVKPEDLVVIDGFNPRTQNADYFAGVRGLADLMVANGYMQDKPISGYITKIDGKDVIAVNDGHRRLAAVKLANAELGGKFHTIPLVLKDRGNNMVDLTLSLLHSNEGQPFTMYEKAVIAKRLKGFGWDNTKIAKEMFCTGAFVGELLTLAGSPQAIQDMVKGASISGTQAVAMVKKHGDRAVEIAKATVATAASKGKTRATAKDGLSEDAQKARNAKKHGWDMYVLLDKLYRRKALTDVMFKTELDEADRLLTAVEKIKVPKVAKPPKVKKEPKVKAPKAPKAAKKVAAKKTSVKPIKTKASSTATPEKAQAFFDSLGKKGADKAQAHNERRGKSVGRSEH